jgi:DNA-directed RNA polymerase specialized sigma24 family protein
MVMSSEGLITQWIRQLKTGDQEAAQKLWEHYFRRLSELALRKLRGSPRRVADEEDIALSAFDSFCRGAAQGRFPQLRDRDNLWPLLVVITERKAMDLVQQNLRKKRGGGKVGGESALRGGEDSSTGNGGIDQVTGKEPTPEFAAQMAEEYERLLGSLDNAELRSIAVWKMEGYTNAEIAAKIGCVSVTVERRLRLIRKIWESPRNE